MDQYTVGSDTRKERCERCALSAICPPQKKRQGCTPGEFKGRQKCRPKGLWAARA